MCSIIHTCIYKRASIIHDTRLSAGFYTCYCWLLFCLQIHIIIVHEFVYQYFRFERISQNNIESDHCFYSELFVNKTDVYNTRVDALYKPRCWNSRRYNNGACVLTALQYLQLNYSKLGNSCEINWFVKICCGIKYNKTCVIMLTVNKERNLSNVLITINILLIWHHESVIIKLDYVLYDSLMQ